VTVYRICSSAYPKNDGEGSRLYGGRWNHKGTPLLYCGSTVSLCALEVLANSEKLPKNMVVIAAEIPDDIEIPAATFDDIPADWNVPMPSTSTKNFGTGWAKMQRHLAFSVPSVIVPDERNYLINPLHSDFPKIKFSAPKPFVFDPRLKQ
jgi:RES domain-containing protein